MPTHYQAQLRHAEHYEQLLSRANELYKEGGDAMFQALEEFDLAWKNISSAQEWLAANAESDPGLARLCSSYPEAGVYVLHLRLPLLVRIRWLQPALEAARRLCLRDAEGWHLVNLAMAYALSGKTEQASAMYEERLAVARETGDHIGEGRVLGNFANLYADIGETEKAIELYHLRLKIARETGDQRGEASVLTNLGDSYADSGDAAQAIKFLEQALHIFRDLKERRNEGITLVNLARAYGKSGDTAKAIELVELSLEVCREVQDKRCEGAAFAILGDVYFDRFELQRAIECYERWEKIARQLEDPRAVANALWRMALGYKIEGKDGAAMEKAQAALSLFEEVLDDTALTIKDELALWSCADS
jgi:tetratricopeptide (TPR) repeat protein